MDLLCIVNHDLAGYRISNCGKDLVREVQGGLAASAVIDDGHHHASALARMGYTVGRTGAPHRVSSPTCCAVAIDSVARCCNHGALVLVAIASGGCQSHIKAIQ